MMAQLRVIADPASRISQVLPTVKCSNCGVPVPLAQLGDHICTPAPALPKPNITPSQAAALLPQRLQNLVTPTRTDSPLRDLPARPLQNERPRINTAISAASAPASSVDVPTRFPATQSPMRPGPPSKPLYSGSESTPTTARPYNTIPSERDIDTRVGGEGGMAGVGRRGFARAALLPPPDQPTALRPNGPRYNDDPRSAGGTPALTPSSSNSSQSPAPSTPPLSQSSSRPRTPSPPNRYGIPPPEKLSFLRSQPEPHVLRKRSLSKGHKRSLSREKLSFRSPSPSSGSEYGGLAYADSDDEGTPNLRSRASPPPPLSLSDSLSKKLNGVNFTHKKSSSSLSSSSDRGNFAHALGLSKTPPKDYDKIGGPGLPRNSRSGSISSSSISSKSNSRPSDSIAVSTGRLDHAMKTLLEDVGGANVYGGDDVFLSSDGPGLSKSKSTGKQRTFDRERGRNDSIDSRFSDKGLAATTMVGARAQRSNTVHTASPDTKPIQLPTRSNSERERSLDPERRVLKRAKVCVRCEKRIEDGKWIQVDGGGVLCERCWKNMYLPKCRRCNLPIEKQAVSSSDGQLKGKYHKECFNCHTCHKPFPDKTFYVYDGKPLCAYHYHEENNSLCASPSCGQPIEGPCAVAHTGARYHPEHLLCEFSGYPKCREKLEDYFEVDGKMLCERHARMSKLAAGDDDDDDNWVENTRAMKRKTRFMNLAGAGMR